MCMCVYMYVCTRTSMCAFNTYLLIRVEVKFEVVGVGRKIGSNCILSTSLVLWHINPYRLFSAKYSLNVYIRYTGFSLVEFFMAYQPL